MGIKKGDTITISFVGKLEDGNIFDSTKEPLEFKVGNNEILPAIDNAVIGMEVGETKIVKISPAEGFGERLPELIKKIPRDALTADREIKQGMHLIITSPEGRKFIATIVDVDKDFITIDLNHPLAGKKLIFEIKILSVK